MIYLKLTKKPETISELFAELFSYKNCSQYKTCKTYLDEECTVQECPENKYRSADDVVEIVQTYFPNANEIDIFTELLLFRIENEWGIFSPYLIHCADISRPTVCFQEEYESPKLNSGFESTEMTKSKYKDWKTICAMVGIHSQKELETLND